MKPINRITSRTVVMPTKDIDTDQIIPARFLTTTTRDGLGENVFADLRYDEDGKARPDFPLNRPDANGCEILVSGRNFGCGSSREHAPWALLDYGIRVVISTEIADIFCSNSLKNGLIPVVIDAETHEWLLQHPGVDVSVDVAAAELCLPDGRTVEFPIERFARHCLTHGLDQLGFLQQHADAIVAFEEMHSWTP